MSPTSATNGGPSSLGISPSLSISLSTLVLVHTTTSPEGKTSLAHALFEPDFLIDSENRIVRLGREQWERVRDSVEGLRIVGRSRSGSRNNNQNTPLETPEQSPNNSFQGSFETTRWFSLAPETSPANSRSTSTLLIQPFGGDGVASKTSDLLAFQIYGVGDSGADICPNSWETLPSQIKTLLTEAERLSEISNSNSGIGSTLSIDDAMDVDDVDVQSQILNLLAK